MILKQQAGKSVFFEGSLRFWYLIIALACMAAYGNTILNLYGLDDHLVTNHNPLIEKGLSGLYEIFTTNYIAEAGIYLDYRPLVKATFALEYTLWGFNPHVSHFVNILLYIIACCLILKVLLQVFGKPYFGVIIAGVLLYAVHPVHTEVVASLKNRDEILVLIFSFSATLFFLKYTNGGKLQYLAIGLLMFLFALLSKISCLPFVASIPLLLYVQRKNIKQPAIVFIALAVLTGAFYAVVIKSLPGFARPYEYVETPFPYLTDYSVKLGTAFYSLLYYVRLLIIPAWFSFYYGYGFVELKTMLSVLPLISLLFHLGILGAAVYLFKRNIFVSFFLFFYLIQISLYSNLVLPLAGIVAERGAFYASLAFAMLLAYLIQRFVGVASSQTADKKGSPQLSVSYSKIQAGLLVAILCLYTVETFARNTDWKDTITLFEADMPHLKTSAKANYMMAKEIRRLYRTDPQLTQQTLDIQSTRAAQYYNQAITDYPQYATAMEELGMVYAIEQKNRSMAIPVFERALAIDSTLWRSSNNLAMCYMLEKDGKQALYWYEKSLRANQDNPKVLVELGKLYYSMGLKQKALETNDKLLKLAPDSYMPYYNYGVYYMLEKDTVTAVKYFEQDIAHGDKETFPFYFLGTYYLHHGDTVNALRIRNLAPKVSR